MEHPKCRAVLWLYAEVNELNKHGELLGNPVYKVERFPLYLTGNSKYEVIQKLNKVLSETKLNVSNS